MSDPVTMPVTRLLEHADDWRGDPVTFEPAVAWHGTHMHPEVVAQGTLQGAWFDTPGLVAVELEVRYDDADRLVTVQLDDTENVTVGA